MINVGVMGVSGRMGQMLVAALAESEAAELSAAGERPGHDWAGQRLGDFVSGGGDVNVCQTPETVFQDSDVVIDFTAPKATLHHAELAQKTGTGLVIGTTGFSDEELAELAKADAPIVRAGNMSLGVNLLTGLTKRVAAALGPDFDIEVVEMHHKHKVDAPSGTALMLGEAAAEGRGVDLGDVSDRGRDGQTGARKRGDIGFAALRGGDVVGEHDVIFAGAGERIILRHLATDRMIFARGAVAAAVWLKGRAPGQYDMNDVLGLKG